MTDTQKAALILHRIHTETGITPQQIMEPSKLAHIVRARHLAYWAIIKALPHWTSGQIVKALRQKDRASALYADCATRRRMMYDHGFDLMAGRILSGLVKNA